MSEWIDVNKRLPISRNLNKYKVRTVEGSISTKKYVRTILGRMTNAGFRFNAGDWVTVTHWLEEEVL